MTYAPGEVRVDTWKDGRRWASATRTTAGAPVRIVLSVDRGAIAGDGRDLAYVTARIVDAKGETVPDAKPALTFEVTGAGTLAATDNGDPTDLVAFPSPGRRAFNGLALAIVRGRAGDRGAVRVVARADGLAGGAVSIAVTPPGRPRRPRDE